MNENASIEDGVLYNALNAFSIREPGLGLDDRSATSIFTIPLLMKKSATPDTYYESNVIELLRVEIEEIRKYLANFCSSKELPEEMKKIIEAQYKLYLDDMKHESEKNPTVYREPLFEKSCDTIINALEDLGLRQEAIQIQRTVTDLVK